MAFCESYIACTEHEPHLTVSYTEEMVVQRLVADHYNQKHQSKILAEAPLLPTLADNIARLQIL